jgi:preprotein translocase subunit SecD
MKSINYLVILLFIIITLCSGMFIKPPKTPLPTANTQTLTLQAGKDAGSVSLKQSADIITARLQLYGVKSFEVKVSTDLRQLKVQLPEATSINEIESLLISRGEVAFYETYNQEELKAGLHPDNKLFTLLNSINDSKPTDPRVGCTDLSGKKKAEDFLASMSALPAFKFAWNSASKSGECLFALRTDNNGNPLINRSDIKEVKITDSNFGAKIMIKLQAHAAGVFAEATKANINKSIAIVIDNKVYSWPVVRDAIEGGEIEVTGDFTEKEVKYLPVIFNTAELPLTFKLVE